MNFDKFCELFPNSGFVKIAPFVDEELEDENLRKQRKAPLNSLKDPLAISQAKNWVSRGARLGWIIPKNYIAIDIDNKDNQKSAEVMKQLLDNHSIKYFCNYSRQGTHFIFRNDSEIMKGKGQFQGYINHIGIQCDGRADGKGYIVLPVNDEKSGRAWGTYPETIDKPVNELLDDLPFWIRPLRPSKPDDISFIDMPDGVGNGAMFKLRGAMSGPNLVTQEESIECLRIINWEIWTDPMPEEAFNASVARPAELTYGNMKETDGTGPKSSKPKSWLNIAKELIERYKLIAVGDFIYKWDGDVYKKLSIHQLWELVHFEGYEEATKAQRKEIIDFIVVHKQVDPMLLDKEYACINFKNGYLDLMNLQLIEAKPDSYNTIKIPHNYNPEVPISVEIEDFMNWISHGNEDRKQLLWEIAGYNFLSRNKLAKFFVFVGTGGTGKSTWGALNKRVFEKQYVSAVALSQMDQDYHLSSLLGSRLNIDDDASNEKVLKDAGRFKSLTAGYPIQVRPIYSEPFEMDSPTKIWIFSNSMIKIMDDSDGLYRRLMLIELDNSFTAKKTDDRDWLDKVTDLDMEYFVCKAAEAINGVLKRGGKFIIEESDEKLRQRFKAQQSSIHKWCQLEGLTVQDLMHKSLMLLYRDYKTWCLECGYKQLNYGNFVEMLVGSYKITYEKDPGTREQIVINSSMAPNYTPFDKI